MKKILCLTGLIAAGLLIFAFNISAEQPSAGESKQAGKTLIMQASWKPGVSNNSRSFGPQWQLIQFGDEFEAVENNEVVTPKSAECLFCHDFYYSELSKRTANWKDKWGDTVNPHLYVDENKADPHNADPIVPDCLRCHREEHALPSPTGPMAAARLNYCYSCHHEESFEACSDCH